MFQISNHQAIDEGAVVLQGFTEIFSRDIISLFPLALQRTVLLSKHLGDLLDHLRFQGIRLLDYRPRFVHKLEPS